MVELGKNFTTKDTKDTKGENVMSFVYLVSFVVNKEASPWRLATNA